MDLIPRGERRRWTIEQKQTIAAQSLAPGASPTNIARLHGISTGQLYTWRHALKSAQLGASMGRFARVDVATHPQPLADIPIPPPGRVEIALPNDTTVRIDAGIDPRALRRVLAALAARSAQAAGVTQVQAASAPEGGFDRAVTGEQPAGQGGEEATLFPRHGCRKVAPAGQGPLRQASATGQRDCGSRYVRDRQTLAFGSRSGTEPWQMG
jgi:transposase